MKLSITGRHLAVTEAARQQIDTKLERLERLLSGSAVSAQCVLSQQRGLFVCELTVHARGDHMLHALGRDAQLPRAVTLAAERVGQQAQKLKDRWKTRRRTPENGAARLPVIERPPRPDSGPRVIRSRSSAVKPMTLDDAMLALSDGAQSFLVFRHAPSDAVAILYRRPDGHFGLIEPEA